MANLEKLDNAITELEKQADDLKEFNSVYSEIAKLKQDILDNLTLLQANNEGLANISAEIGKGLGQSQAKIDELLQANNEGLAKISVEIGKGLDQSQAKIDELLQANNEGLAKISQEIGKGLDQSQAKIDEIYKDNKAFQKELDGSIASRLDKHKSDIQVVIREEGNQIQHALGIALNSNFISLELKLKDEFSKQTKQINTLKILLFVLTAISIGLAIGLFIK